VEWKYAGRGKQDKHAGTVRCQAEAAKTNKVGETIVQSSCQGCWHPGRKAEGRRGGAHRLWQQVQAAVSTVVSRAKGSRILWQLKGRRAFWRDPRPARPRSGGCCSGGCRDAVTKNSASELTHSLVQAPSWPRGSDILPAPEGEAHISEEAAPHSEVDALDGEVIELGWTGAAAFPRSGASSAETWRRNFQKREEERIAVLFCKRQARLVAAPEAPPSKAAGASCGGIAEVNREAFSIPVDGLRFSSRARAPVQRLADQLLQEQESRAASQRLSASSKVSLCGENAELNIKKKSFDGPEHKTERKARLFKASTRLVAGARHEKALAKAVSSIALLRKGDMQRCDRVKRFTTLISALESSGVCEVERDSGEASPSNPTGIKTLVLKNQGKFYEQVPHPILCTRSPLVDVDICLPRRMPCSRHG
jgi:hypothetical protein